MYVCMYLSDSFKIKWHYTLTSEVVKNQWLCDVM